MQPHHRHANTGKRTDDRRLHADVMDDIRP